ncbi:SusD/RagB family nutrient-binding outer membrane lipoprotein [Dinghuibacter silviterrae]|uniref:SusD-like starch-binding protein associating with outer membrane n=1 Tax=Dinghuibacter silviterrae TaxID=1539049 RepID=A0A4R8DEP7_9BACT|nr:SusD/RagB family nutrient-binding outer membrane lipoprotein [Dinghuibacter silviterrae]TDW96033.1 SusD-like starch-binding protein associating with outer membrane [Dinghuibacter silviterrae]
MTRYNKGNALTLGTALMLIVGLASCTKNFKTINTPWNGSPTPTLPQLFTAFVANLDATANTEQRDDNGWIYPITQQGAVYTKSDYLYGGSTSAWSDFYSNLSNYTAAMNFITAQPDTAIYTNVKAMLKTLRAYQAIKVSNFWGDIPFSKAGQAISNSTAALTPAYDSQQSIYLSCLSDLTWAVNNLSATDATQFALGTSDGVLNGNITQWIKFANSLRLRFALTIYGKDPTDAGPIIADALTKPLLSAYTTADNIGLYEANIAGLTFPARAYSFGTECRLRMGTCMWEWMSSTNALDGSGIFDPRCTIFFEGNNANQWNPYPQNPTSSTPAEQGDPYNTLRDADWANKDGDPSNPTTNLYANFNYYWSRDGVISGSNGAIPELFMTAAEVHFLKAEAYAGGYGVSQDMATAQTEYYAGITASVNFWTTMAMTSSVWVVNKPTSLPNNATMTAFLANPVVAFNSATALKQIYAQEWIDMIRQPWDAWTLMRRTGIMTPQDPNNASYYTTTYGGYQRYTYPSSESQLNYNNWYAETKGVDVVSAKIWIAK